jgi:SPP1 gp7 family putative phage head morphogenesis protein
LAPANGKGGKAGPAVMAADAEVQAIAQAVQKLYLGVGPMLTSLEARAIVNRLGAGLVGDIPPAPPPNPIPAQLAQPAALGELPPANPSEGRSAVRAPSAAEAKARREKLAAQADARLRDLEVVWRRAFQRLLDRQRDAVLARLEGKRGRQMLREGVAPDASQLFDRGFWGGETETLAQEMYAQVASVSGAVQATATGADFKLTDPWVQKMIRDRAQYLSPQVSDTTYAGIKDALARGVSEGEGIPELSTRIRDLFDQTYAARAETVARTEVVSAYNGVTHGFTLETPEVAGLEWISTLDSRTRLSHAAMDGTIIRKGEAFNLDGAVLAFPGDPNVQAPQPGSVIINCRCTVAPVVREDMPPELMPAAPAAPIAPAAPSTDGGVLADVSFATPAIEAKYRPTFERLNELHGGPRDTSTKTTIKRIRKGSAANAQFRADLKVNAIEMGEADDGTDLLSAIHEYGHRLDWQPTIQKNTSTPQGNIIRWATEDKQSPAVQALMRAAAETPTIAITPPRWTAKYRNYFRSVPEVWARAYSQWAAEKLGGPELASLRAWQDSGNVMQWTDEEFAALRPLVEDVLREWGML